MLNENKERALAHIEKIINLEPIENADKIEVASVLGWKVVVKKDEFKIGEKVIYIEIDSKVPDKPEFEFLRDRKFRIRTIKLRGQISQGLIMPMSILGKDCDIGTDVTKELEITYYEVEDNTRKAPSVDKYKSMAQRNAKLFKTKPFRWLMRRNWGKKFLFAFFGKKKDKKNGWPNWVVKTDEERVENMPWVLKDKAPWIATEKIDGTSTTFTMKRGIFKNQFYVCSRNVVFPNETNKQCYYNSNVYWEMAKKYGVENILNDLLKQHKDWKWVTLQGETFGDGIQKKNYDLINGSHDFRAFNLINSYTGRWNSVQAKKLLEPYGIKWVPILDENYILPDTIDELRNYVNSEPSIIDGEMKEGIVFRSQDGAQSFKCVSPEFLMKYHY